MSPSHAFHQINLLNTVKEKDRSWVFTMYHVQFYAMVTNKTDIVRFQWFAHHRQIWQSPGHRNFIENRNLYWVVTYRTGAGRRLYMQTSADAWPGTVWCRTVSGRRCKRSAGHRTVPSRFYTNFHVQWWIHLYQNLPSFLQKKAC